MGIYSDDILYGSTADNLQTMQQLTEVFLVHWERLTKYAMLWLVTYIMDYLMN